MRGWSIITSNEFKETWSETVDHVIGLFREAGEEFEDYLDRHEDDIIKAKNAVKQDLHGLIVTAGTMLDKLKDIVDQWDTTKHDKTDGESS